MSNFSEFLAPAAGPAPLVRVGKVHNGERRRGTSDAQLPDVDSTLLASCAVVWRRAGPLAQSTSNALVRRLVAPVCALDASWRRAYRRTLEAVPGSRPPRPDLLVLSYLLWHERPTYPNMAREPL